MRKTSLGSCFAVLLAAWAVAPATADDRSKMPSIELPAALKPYSNESNVLEAATGVLKLLATAAFDEPEADSPFAKERCNTPDMASFYRGMTLMQAGYFMFINKVERGFEATDSPHFALGEGFALVPAGFGALVRPGRELLVAIWDKDRLARLLDVVTAVREMPPTIKGDLITYFTALQEFGRRYDALKRRAPLDLAKLNERATRLYSYEREDKLVEAKLKGADELRMAEARYPERVFYEDYAREMRLLLDANRGLGLEKLSECMDGGRFASVRIGGKGELTYFPYGLYPASYMIGFWQRREAEGTTLLARFAIDRLLAELQRPN